ncbi:MAG: DNA polymerase, partial [Chloroflexota bacterium]
VLGRYGLDVTPVAFDTMIAEWMRDSASNNLGLSKLVMHGGLLDEGSVMMQDISTLIGKGKKQITMAAVPVTKAAPYAAEDAAMTWRLVEPLQEKLIDYEGAQRIFQEIEMPLVPVISAIERAGVQLDTPYLRDMSVMLERQLAEIEREIYDLSGGYGEFNINSPKQLNDVLFGKLDLPRAGIRKTTHGYSTAADVLDKLYADTGHPILEKILENRELTKLKGTYVDALPELVNERTGRLHTSFNQTGTTTGRISSSNPNLQNIPIRTELGRQVRRAFTVKDGYLLLSVDYSQVELRIMAHIADEPYLKSAFEDGLDIHAATAAVVNDIPLEDVSYEQRSFAKRVNFGLLYGMSAFRLARDSDLTLAEANQFVETYFERLPAVKAYIETTKAQPHNHGYVETLMGRRRYFGDTRNMGRNDVGRAEREAINMPIQGTAADIMKKAMLDLHHALQDQNLGAYMTLQ